jgi:hypothetical protein
MTQRRDRGAGIEEVLEDPADVGIVTEVLGCPPAGHHHRNIIGRVTWANATSACHERPGFSVYVSRPSTKSWTTNCKVFTVGGDVDLVSLLQQALVGVHHFEILGCVAGQ